MKYGANESSLSDGELCLLAGLVDAGLEPLEGSADRGVAGWRVGSDVGEDRSQEPSVGAGEEQRHAQSQGGGFVTMAVWNALDESMQPQAAQIVAHPALGVMGRVETQQLSQQGSHVGMGEPPRLQAEQLQHAEQRLYTPISETQRRSPLSLHLDGAYHLLKRLFTDRAIMGNRLDVQKTSVGFKADLPQGRQVLELLDDPEVEWVVDGCLRPQRPAFLVILLDARAL
jgi:hypothetical protein